MMFAAWGVGLPLPILNLVAALIYHFVNRKSSRFVAFNSLQSMLSQVPVTLANLGIVIWLIQNLVRSAAFTRPFFICLVLAVIINILYITLSLVAMVWARKGRFYYIPFFGRLAFNRFFGPNAIDYGKPVPPNIPPEGL